MWRHSGEVADAEEQAQAVSHSRVVDKKLGGTPWKQVTPAPGQTTQPEVLAPRR